MPMTFSVEQSLDSWVQDIQTPRPPDGKWHPSSLYGCERKAVYEIRGTEQTNPPDARTRRVFRVGHIFHSFIQDAVEKQAGSTIEESYREIPIEIPELNIVGHADGLVRFDTGVWELQEFKSIKSTAFKFGNLPKPEHVGQITPYMRGLRDHGSSSMGIPPLGESLTRARVAYVSKDDMAISEHSVFWTETRNEDLVTRVEALNPFRAGSSLPPRLPAEKGKRNWACGYCPFAQKCWEIDGE